LDQVNVSLLSFKLVLIYSSKYSLIKKKLCQQIVVHSFLFLVLYCFSITLITKQKNIQSYSGHLILLLKKIWQAVLTFIHLVKMLILEIMNLISTSNNGNF